MYAKCKNMPDKRSHVMTLLLLFPGSAAIGRRCGRSEPLSPEYLRHAVGCAIAVDETIESLSWQHSGR